LERYLKTRKGLAPRTVDFYQKMLAGPLKPIAKVPLDSLARDRVRSLHERITERNGAAMANGAMRTAKALINDVLRDTDLPHGNVVSRAVRFNRVEARNWAISPEELPEVWGALAEMENRALSIAWEVALCTGLRSGDVKKMRWENWDHDGVLFVPSPKGGRAFSLPLTRHVLQRLEELRDLTAPWSSPWCFPARSKSGHLESMRRASDWPWAAHAFRHTYRTVAMEAGVPSDMVQVLMNHSSGGASAVSWGYVTRANLLGPMRDAAERVVDRLLSYRT
ncbi:MAG: tyrosine-type recombinase/integrase, partial [Pseudomonadota bacterium]